MGKLKTIHTEWTRQENTRETDNFETRNLEPVIREFFENLSLPFDDYNPEISILEFRSRAGFSPFSHNHGGMDLFIETNVAYLIGSGNYFGLGIQKWVEKSWADAIKEVKKMKPELQDGSDELDEAVYEYCQDDYEGVAWRIRAMYEGDGVLTIHAGYDFDAPYFRWSNGAAFEHTLKFRTLSGLKRQLKTLKGRIEKSQEKPTK